MDIGPWDVALVVGVSAHATIIAYLYRPKWKAFMLSLPVPFTLASMSLGHRVAISNVVAMAMLQVWALAVLLLYRRLRVPIVLSIALAAGAYCAAGSVLVGVLPAGDAAFWCAAAGAWALGLVLFMSLPHREEPGHRSSLPVWVKLPVIVCVILFLVMMKSTLKGFMTMFPMIGVVAAYEARHSLWAIVRQMPILMMTMVPMMAVCRIAQGRGMGLGPSLALGWIVLLALLVPLTRIRWAETTEATPDA